MTPSAEGEAWERQVVKYMREKGTYCIRIPHSTGGQPADIVALPPRGAAPMVIECKHCRSDRWPLSQLRDNQITTMNAVKPYADFYIAIHFESGPTLIPSSFLDDVLSSGHTSLHYEEVTAYAL